MISPSSNPPMQLRTGWRRRMQARFLARFGLHYERMVEARKRALLGNLIGDILEIGPGTGPNLPFYSPGARWIGIEPNAYMHPYLRTAAGRLGISSEIRGGTAEHIPAADSSIDAVVGTLVLCSVDEPARVLAEILRVLKPGGRFLFIEHVAAPRGTWLRLLQRLIRPVFQAIGDGCHPDRETWAAIDAAGFEQVRFEHFRLPLGIIAPQISGVAVKATG